MNKLCDSCGRLGIHCPQCGGRTFYLLIGQLASSTSVVDGNEVVTKHYKCRKCGPFSSIDDVVVNCKATRSLTQSALAPRDARLSMAEADEVKGKSRAERLAFVLEQQRKIKGGVA